MEKLGRGKASKAGKGTGRKPSPERLEVQPLKLPATLRAWVRAQPNQSGYISRLIAEDMAKYSEADQRRMTGNFTVEDLII